MNIQDKERGGIVVFAIVGVLLAGLLIGGLYLSKNQARIARDNESPTVAIDTAKEAEEAEEKSPATTKDETKNTPAPAPSTPAPKPDTSTKPATPAAPSVPSTRLPTSGPSSAVPATGPADTFLGIVVVTTITFVSFVFFQSNSRLRRSALDS